MSDQQNEKDGCPAGAGQPAARSESEGEAPDAAEEQAFVESLISTGQAAKTDKNGKLPAGATHEIVESAEGELKVVRRRFSAW